MRRARRSPALIAGAFLVTFMVAISVLAPFVAPYDPETQNLGGGLAAPSASHWFGTDQLGRDILSRVIWAGRTDLRIAVLAAIIPFITGLVVGLVSGYAGGRIDWVIGRIVDTFVAFPFYVLIIAIVFAVGTGENGIFIAYALVGWISSARVIRAKTKALCREGWVGAAYGGGLSHPRVVARHLLPNVLPQAVVLLMTEILLIMVAVVTLGYLGLGVQPPTPDWGTMISDGQLFLATKWWIPSLARSRRRHHRHRAVAAGRRARGRVEAAMSVGVGGLAVTGLRISGETELVHGVDLALAPGEALGIVGESGSGKTLTLRAVMGLLPRGLRVSGGTVEAGGRVAMIFQDPLSYLDPMTRVGTLLAEICRAQHGGSVASARARARELFVDVRLPDPDTLLRRYPHQLSGGQRQRVLLAIALAAQPDILLCDEPTTALDVTVQAEVLALLDELRARRGLSLLFVSHDLAVVASLCDRVVVFRDGLAVETGRTADIVNRPTQAYTKALVDAVLPLPALAEVGGE